MRVALATSAKWPELSPDDQPLRHELARIGVAAEPAIWTDREVDWKSFALVVIRSCWDYHLVPDRFLGWLESLDQDRVAVANRMDVVEWNAHKQYLLDLERHGVRIPATLVLPQGSKTPRPEAARLVVKPAISASAFETHLTDGNGAPVILERLLAQGDVIVQEFIPEVVTDGEWSLVYFEGHLSHAVKKAPKRGDFRVQEEHGGSAEPGEPPASVAMLAERALRSVGEEVLYARVDVVERDQGALLMELELIEPSLFLRLDPLAPRRFAEAIKRLAGR